MVIPYAYWTFKPIGLTPDRYQSIDNLIICQGKFFILKTFVRNQSYDRKRDEKQPICPEIWPGKLAHR